MYKTKTNYCLTNLIQANEKRKKKVACIYNNKIVKVYNSLSEVKEDGFTFTLAGKVARGERLTHKGFEWKYI